MAQLSVYRGDTFSRSLSFTNNASAVIDITDWIIFFTVKKNEEDSDDNAVIKKDITVHTNAALGLSSISLDDDDTDIAPRDYWYDIQVKKDTGEIKTITKDKFIVHTDITRRTEVEGE